jgi:hypothetical protein
MVQRTGLGKPGRHRQSRTGNLGQRRQGQSCGRILEPLYIALQLGLTAALAAGLPVASAMIGAAVITHLAPPDFFTLPVLRRAALIGGILFAVMLLSALPGNEHFQPGVIWATDSPWEMDFREFLHERVLPYLAGAPELYRQPLAELPVTLQILLGIETVLLTTAVALPFRVWRPGHALRSALTAVAIAVLAALLTIYAVCLAYWALHELNFWAIGLLGIVYQHYRSRRH